MAEASRANGRFPKGHSGNPKGRPRKLPSRHRLPASNRMTAFEVGEMQISINGGSESTTLYRGVLISMGQKALAGHAPSQKAFLERIDRAAAAYGDSHALIQFLFRETAKLEGLVDAYEDRARASKKGVLVLSQEEWDERTAALNQRWEERKHIGFT